MIWNRGSEARRRRQARAERGVALVAVLWVVAALAIIAGAFGAGRRADLRLVRNLEENARAQALADAGVHAAVLGLMQSRAEDLWPADGTPRTIRLDGGTVRVAIRSEAGKVDLNTGDRALAGRLLGELGVAGEERDALLDAIADFRDEDDLRRLRGAEDSDYRAAGLSWGAKDAPFARVEELRFVLGVTPELFRRLAPNVTVYSRRRGVDLAVAPPQVRQAAGVGKDAGDSRAKPWQGGGRRVYTVRAMGRTESGASFLREAVVRLSPDPVRPYAFLHWRHALAPDQGGDRPGAVAMPPR